MTQVGIAHYKSFWIWYIMMVFGMVLAAVPGFLLAPYSINVFDEPYQILNAMEWESAVYSPLSSWSAHWFGILFNWKYLAFRYLALTLNLLGILIAASYAFFCSRQKITIIVSSILCSLLGMTFRGTSNYYGWDNLTILTLSICVVLFFSLLKKFSWNKLIWLAITCTITTFMRIPNGVVFIFTILIFLCRWRINKNSLLRIVIFSSIYILVSYLFISFLYGDVATYYVTIKQNSINDHSIFILLKSQVYRFVLSVIFAFVFYLLYRWLGFTAIKTPGLKNIVMVVIAIIIGGSILFGDGAFGFPLRTGPTSALGLLLFSYFILFLDAKRNHNTVLISELLVLFLFSAAAGIGSNIGYAKSMIWPCIPLIILLFNDQFTWKLRTVFITWSAAYFIYSLVGIKQYNFDDRGLSQLTYKFEDRSFVLHDMYTHPERGQFIENLYNEAKPYVEKGFLPIVLKAGNEYMWEYFFLAPNMHQRHNFCDWYAFWDATYVEDVRNDIMKATQPVIIIYRQIIDTENITPMLRMLRKNTVCIMNKPGYSFWMKKEDIPADTTPLAEPIIFPENR